MPRPATVISAGNTTCQRSHRIMFLAYEYLFCASLIPFVHRSFHPMNGSGGPRRIHRDLVNGRRGVLSLLRWFYNIILTDCGTALVHSAMAGVLAEADVLVIVASPAVNAARSALATLDWLEQDGYSHLIPGATVVISASRPGPLGLDIDRLAGNFLPIVRALHVLPFEIIWPRAQRSTSSCSPSRPARRSWDSLPPSLTASPPWALPVGFQGSSRPSAGMPQH